MLTQRGECRPRARPAHLRAAQSLAGGQPNREPLKRPRDIAQAKAYARMVIEHMPHLPFDEALTALHGDVRAMRAALGI
jgi:hypothetical protein